MWLQTWRIHCLNREEVHLDTQIHCRVLVEDAQLIPVLHSFNPSRIHQGQNPFCGMAVVTMHSTVLGHCHWETMKMIATKQHDIEDKLIELWGHHSIKKPWVTSVYSSQAVGRPGYLLLFIVMSRRVPGSHWRFSSTNLLDGIDDPLLSLSNKRQVIQYNKKTSGKQIMVLGGAMLGDNMT